MRCIFSIDFICEMRSGSSARLMITVWITIAQPQFGTMWLYVHFSHRNSGRAITPSQPKSTSLRRSGSAPAGSPGIGTDSRTSRDFGPTYRRSTVGPPRLPDCRAQDFTSDASAGRCGFSQRAARRPQRSTADASCGSEEDGGKILIAHARPLKGAANGVSANDLLQRDALNIVVRSDTRPGWRHKTQH